MERGLPRMDGGGRLGDHYCDNGGSRTAAAAAATEVDDDDGVRRRELVEGDSKSTGGGGGHCTGGGRREVSVTRRVAFTAVKVFVAATALIVTCAFIWYTMGLPFLLQVVVVAFIAFVASGGYKFIYLVYRTAPRDLKSVHFNNNNDCGIRF